MKPETRRYFEEHRRHYDMMVGQDYIPKVAWGMPGEIYNLIREEFDPGYENDTQCPPCAFAIVRHGYYLFDQAVKAEKIIVHATFPKQDATLKIPVTSMDETPEEKKVRLSDPKRIIKRRSKRK